MTTSKATRRRLNIAQMSTKELHAICGTFDRQRTSADLSERQEWLYDLCVGALEDRHRAQRYLTSRCWCRYCVPPFPEC